MHTTLEADTQQISNLAVEQASSELAMEHQTWNQSTNGEDERSSNGRTWTPSRRAPIGPGERTTRASSSTRGGEGGELGFLERVRVCADWPTGDGQTMGAAGQVYMHDVAGWCRAAHVSWAGLCLHHGAIHASQTRPIHRAGPTPAYGIYRVGL
jgi:hypothetical protein